MGVWIYSSYRGFYRESKQLRDEYTAHQKKIQDEVDRVIREIDYCKSEAHGMLKEDIQERIDEAHNIAMSIYEENKDSRSRSEMIDILSKTFSKLTFNGGGATTLEEGLKMEYSSLQTGLNLKGKKCWITGVLITGISSRI